MSNPIKLKALVLSVRNYGSGTYEVEFEPASAVPRFKAGQFLHLAVDEYDPAGGFWPESRVFSIASAPGAQNLKIVYSVKGAYTKRMEALLRPTMEVWLKLPYGNFIIDSLIKPGQDVVLIAGGTGISPFLPYLSKLVDTSAKQCSVCLYYGIRENGMLLASELLEACARGELVKTNIFVENEEPSSNLPRSARVRRGRLSIEVIARETSALRDPVFFISGPPTMISAFKIGLGSMGVEPTRVKIDEWE